MQVNHRVQQLRTIVAFTPRGRPNDSPFLIYNRKPFLIIVLHLNYLKKHRWQGVLALLGQFALHTADGGLEEECHHMLVCAIRADLLED